MRHVFVLFVSLVVSPAIERLYYVREVCHGCRLADENEYSFVDSGSKLVPFNSLVRSFSAIVICPQFSSCVSAAAQTDGRREMEGLM